MCGRYSLAPGEFSEIRIEFGVEPVSFAGPRYNIAPTWAPGYEPPIVIAPGGVRQLLPARFWMIPSTWSRPLADLPTAFNARAEELSAKPFWAQSFESRRCLVPTTGYREFQGPRGKRRPFQFHQQPPLFAFGGVWDRWKAPDGAVVTSFAIVTVAANDVVLPVHDRMPLRLSPQAYEAWLSPALSGEQALGVALGAAVSPLLSYEANPVGNDSRREGPECIEPAARRQLKLF